MIILGVDPGLAKTGFGVIKKEGRNLLHLASGHIASTTELPLAERLKKIYDHLNTVVQTHRPEMVVVENIFVAKNANSALKLGQVRGVVFLLGALQGLPIFEYPPREVKMGVTGHGNAEKGQVADMVRHFLKVETFSSADASDALALAIYHAGVYSFNNRIKYQEKK